MKFLALADGATQRAKRWMKRLERRSGWGRALRKQLEAVFSDRASRRVGKNSIYFTEKDHQTRFFVSFSAMEKEKKCALPFPCVIFTYDLKVIEES